MSFPFDPNEDMEAMLKQLQESLDDPIAKLIINKVKEKVGRPILIGSPYCVGRARDAEGTVCKNCEGKEGCKELVDYMMHLIKEGLEGRFPPDLLSP